MHIGIVMPVILQERSLFEYTFEAVECLKTSHTATLYVICNRLHLSTEEELQAELESRFSGKVIVINESGVTRSVSESWNLGATLAIADGAQYINFVANDTRLREDCLDVMVAFGESGDADLWSGIAYNQNPQLDPLQITDGADFTCFMVRPSTLQQYGWFDSNFKPAYFEDNDYYARVVLGGGRCRILHAAQFYHHGSATIHQDPEAAHHVRHWFEVNRSYFAKKWGVSQPAGSSEGVLQHYYSNPFNDRSRPLSWFPSQTAEHETVGIQT